ncbi:MAG: alpha/beta fold hydrolase, partial [Flavobacteriales bacterium]
MKLHYKKMGEGSPLLILHGLFGSGDNWQTLARKYGEEHEVYLIDQRNHGHSPHSNEFSYELMAADLAEFIEDQGFEEFSILGHSMGGKTAMVYAMNYDQGLEQMIIVDMAPKAYPVHHRSILDGLISANLSEKTSRKQVQQHIEQFEPNVSVQQFLMKNLYWKNKGELAWRFNVPVLNDTIEAMVAQPVEGVSHVDTLFIRGGKSNYILEEDEALLKQYFPFSTLFSIEEAGHW